VNLAILTLLLESFAAPAAARVHASSPGAEGSAERGANESATTREISVQRVEFTISGPNATTTAIQALIDSLLERYWVQTTWTVKPAIGPRDVFATEDSAALARIWLDLRSKNRALLYVVDRQHDRFLVRVIPLDQGYDEVGRESLGAIVESVVDALLSGADIGVSRELAEQQVAEELQPQNTAQPEPKTLREQQTPKVPTETRPAAQSAPPKTHLWNARLGYRVGALSGEPILRHGPEAGLELALGRTNHVHPILGVALGYRVPVTWETAEAAASFQGLGAALSIGVESSASAVWSWSGSAYGGSEWLRLKPLASNASEARPVFSLFEPVVGVMGRVARQLGTGWGLTAGLGAELDVAGNHFDVARSGKTTPVLVPWRVMPTAVLGLYWRP
jgi:hypothetical protein